MEKENASRSPVEASRFGDVDHSLYDPIAVVLAIQQRVELPMPRPVIQDNMRTTIPSGPRAELGRANPQARIEDEVARQSGLKY